MSSRFQHNDEEKKFWLEFQVCSDGLSSGSTKIGHTRGSFTCFNELPPELRLKIWACLIQPRVVIAACLDSERLQEKRRQLAERPKQCAVPVLLHTCHEARELALKHYELVFSWKIPHMLASDNKTPPLKSEARVWFNFELDALLLLGDLEPHDYYGFNTPMVYFLRREDTNRVKHVACAFEELHYGEYESEHIFGCLFHILDRFHSAKRLLITSTQRDLDTKKMVLSCPPDNIIQKIWRGWISGATIVTSSLADTQILMIQESDLEPFITRHC